jgi:hypothetical protein
MRNSVAGLALMGTLNDLRGIGRNLSRLGSIQDPNSPEPDWTNPDSSDDTSSPTWWQENKGDIFNFLIETANNIYDKYSGGSPPDYSADPQYQQPQQQSGFNTGTLVTLGVAGVSIYALSHLLTAKDAKK